MDKTINFTITPVWAVIEHIRKKIQSQLSDCVNKDIVDATMICAIELTENAVKYGESVPNMQYIQFQLNYKNNEIEVRVSNGVVKKTDVDKLCSTIDKINNGANVEQLYLDRLTELMEQAAPQKSQLGVLRIANETGYKMTYEMQQDALTIIARRQVH